MLQDTSFVSKIIWKDHCQKNFQHTAQLIKEYAFYFLKCLSANHSSEHTCCKLYNSLVP